MAAENLYCIRAISLDELASDVLNKILVVHLTANPENSSGCLSGLAGAT
jgi:hypothetical protein